MVEKNEGNKKLEKAKNNIKDEKENPNVKKAQFEIDNPPSPDLLNYFSSHIGLFL